MSIETELRTWVLGDSDIVDEIADRIFPVFAPSTAPQPYIVFRLMANERIQDMQGPQNAEPVFRLTCWTDDYDDTIALATLVRKRLDNSDRDDDWGTINMQHAKLTDESDAFEPSPELLEKQYYGRQLDFLLFHNE